MRRLTLCLILLMVGCAQDTRELELSDLHGLPEPKIEFLGVAGFLLHWRGEALLLDPFFSRPSVLQLLWMTPDTAEIDKRMPESRDVSMLLIGHAHFDHMLDVAWVMRQHTPNAIVYGSTTAGHILRSELPASRVVDAQIKMAHVQASSGKTLAARDPWFYSKGAAIRAMPIQSMHAPNGTGLHLMEGGYDHDLSELPTFFNNWKEGQTLAWLVDLLDEHGRAVYRIHYQDSASVAPYGFPPELNDHIAVDMDILPVASWDQVAGYPQALLAQTKPRIVVLCHWEDFFGGSPDDPKILRGQKNEPGMVRAVLSSLLAKGRLFIPRPFSEIPLDVHPSETHQSLSL